MYSSLAITIFPNMKTCRKKFNARHGFNPQIDRAAIRRTDYPAMGGNQLVTENQAHKWVQAGLDRHRLLSQRRRRRRKKFTDGKKIMKNTFALLFVVQS